MTSTMERTTLVVFRLLTLTLLVSLGLSNPVGARRALPYAETLYREGRFDAAGTAYRSVASSRPNDYQAITHLGYIALFSNRFDDAKAWLSKAVALNPLDARPRYALAQAFYRRDDFASAATILANLRKADSTIAGNYSSMYLPKLASFRSAPPNVISGSGEITRLKFVKLNPLPIVRVRVNGRSALFFLDTGGGETVLDPQFARELKTQQFGSVQGRFSGGQGAPVGSGRVHSLMLGQWTMHNVPVQIIGTRQLSGALGVKQVDGILGTVVFYHFLTTFDYLKGELVLRRKASANSRRFLAQAGKSASVPFWLAGDHFILARGRVNALPTILFFVDTGIAGAGAKLTQATIQRAGIRLAENRASRGAGSGGTFRIVPYTIPRLSLGQFSEKNVAGVFDGPLPMATVLGFDVPGMIGHGAFLRHSITFDFSSMRMFVQ